MIEELQNNQLALTKGFNCVIDANRDISTLQYKLPAIKGDKQEREPSYLSVDNRFNKNDKEIIDKCGWKKPFQLLN